MPSEIALLVVGVLAVIALYGARSGWHRQDGCATLAGRRHLAFNRQDSFALPSRYGHLHLFSQGHDRQARSIAHGSDAAGQVMACYYSARLGPTQRWAHTDWSVMMLDTPGWRPGALITRSVAFEPAGFFDRYQRVPCRDTDAVIYCERPAWMRGWLDAGGAAFLAGCDAAVTWEMHGSVILAYVSGLTDADGFDRLMTSAIQLAGLSSAETQDSNRQPSPNSDTVPATIGRVPYT